MDEFPTNVVNIEIIIIYLKWFWAGFVEKENQLETKDFGEIG